MKVLVVFSNPAGHVPLRLGNEDKLLRRLAKKHEDVNEIERLHASETTDIREVILESDFDIIQFSGHGSPDGIYLDKGDLSPQGELASAQRVVSLVALADKQPLLVVLLSCYSNDSLTSLVEIAPFVITAMGTVNDDACIEFIGGLYEKLFAGFSVHAAFDHAVARVNAAGLESSPFRLDRRQLIQNGDSKLIESTPDPRRNSLLVNLDAVEEDLGNFGMPEEQICHLLARKLSIHYWIFAIPRERCIIPIGKLLFG